MEGEKEEREGTQSETTSAQVDALTHNCSAERDDTPSIQEPEEGDQADSGVCDNKAGEDSSTSEVEPTPQEAVTATKTQGHNDTPPLAPPHTEGELTLPSVSSHPSSTLGRPSEPCWYCLRSLDTEYCPQTPQQEDSDPLSPLPPSGHKMCYQTDPRPHFGVAWSSHSTCRPLWGSDGPCRGPRQPEVSDQTHTCPHCHLGLPADTLRWHEAKCLLFEGLRTAKK